ncbi:MAG: hypothetical protein HQM05_15345 [Magnetococcales bacterium]|nr:hypothetical protein [Magnetococcales bacterium]
MIKGCSNHNCAVKGNTPGMHTNGICGCVDFKIRENEAAIEINGQKVGPGYFFDYKSFIRKFSQKRMHDHSEQLSKMRIVCEWLKDGGLHDILKLAEAKDETDKKGGGSNE